MRKSINQFLIVSFLLLSTQAGWAQEKQLEGTITLSGAWAVYPTAVAWAEGFKKQHPQVRIDISAGGAGKGASDAIAGLVDIGMVSREPDPQELSRGVQAVYVLKDAVFPVVSEKNLFLEDLFRQGIKKETLSEIYITGTISKWEDVTGKKSDKRLHVFTRSDASGAAASWAGYFGKKQEDLRGIGVYGDPGLLETVKRDPLGLGYNNFSFVFTKEGGLTPGIKLVPIDADGNGNADADEIIENKEAAIAAIEAQKYPVRRKNFFFIKPAASELTKEFIRFALSPEGTGIVNEIGLSLPLNEKERQESLDTLK